MKPTSCQLWIACFFIIGLVTGCGGGGGGGSGTSVTSGTGGVSFAGAASGVSPTSSPVGSWFADMQAGGFTGWNPTISPTTTTVTVNNVTALGSNTFRQNWLVEQLISGKWSNSALPATSIYFLDTTGWVQQSSYMFLDSGDGNHISVWNPATGWTITKNSLA